MNEQEKLIKEIAGKYFDPEENLIVKLSNNDEGHSNQYALCNKFGAMVVFNVVNHDNSIFNPFDLDGFMANRFFLEKWLLFIEELEK